MPVLKKFIYGLLCLVFINRSNSDEISILSHPLWHGTLNKRHNKTPVIKKFIWISLFGVYLDCFIWFS